ncbi:MAG: hypothetical protein AB7Q16_24020 [Vicinamibacterales bacterium]
MARIRTAAPPEMTFEGQLQRMRDRNQAAAAGEADEDVGEPAPALSDEEDDDMLLDDAPDPPPTPVRCQMVARSSHRQPPRPTSATGTPSWWVTQGREGFTQAGEKATEQSRHRKEAAGIGLGSLAKES